jgi:hypothetical protein
LALVAGDGRAVGERMAACWKAQANVTAHPLLLPIDRDGLTIL